MLQVAVQDSFWLHWRGEFVLPFPVSSQVTYLTCCRRLPLLLSVVVTDTGRLIYHQTLHMPGNVLDVTLVQALNSESIILLVSIDTIHLPGSCKEFRSHEFVSSTFCRSFALVSCRSSAQQTEVPSFSFVWESSKLGDDLNETIASSGSTTATYEVPPAPENPKPYQASSYYSALGEFLYGLENLRKKRSMEAAEAERDQDEEGAPATTDNAGVGDIASFVD
jgi:hypothetical protein